MDNNVQCNYDGCNLRAKYKLYRFYLDKEKEWLSFCDKHDRQIARENVQIRKQIEGKK